MSGINDQRMHDRAKPCYLPLAARELVRFNNLRRPEINGRED